MRWSEVVSVSRPAWTWSSIPLDWRGEPWSSLVSDHAQIRWYNPRGVLRRDLHPLLTVEEGGMLEQPVLEISVDTQAGIAAFTPATWAGLTQPISMTPPDSSKDRFLGVWVNDGVWDHSLTHAVLHIDLGRVSEDAFWQATSAPNGWLDTEDRNFNTKLDAGEDTGLDGVPDVGEPGYSASTNPDPNGDDYRYDQAHPTDYEHVNGTEGNSQGDPNGRPDSEDLNRNGLLDVENDYFGFSIDLSDTSFVRIDVAREYPGLPGVGPTNGWRFFGVPVRDVSVLRLGWQRWNRIEACRVWLSDMVGPTRIQIAGVSLMGEFPPAPAIPAELDQNRPNPFSPGTMIPYVLSEDAQVRLEVYDLQGRLVRELVNGVKSAGPHLASWSGRDEQDRPVASGVYFYRFETGGRTASRRMVLAR